MSTTTIDARFTDVGIANQDVAAKAKAAGKGFFSRLIEARQRSAIRQAQTHLARFDDETLRRIGADMDTVKRIRAGV